MDIPHQLVILGLDGLPPKLIASFARDRVMPFMAELLRHGSLGPLHSVIPANTGSGWNSAWTGRTPVKHGYFGFCHYDFEDDTIRLSISDHLRTPTLWEMLNRHGLKTIVINSPMQFPATKLDGVMVSGFMTPSPQSHCTYPADFRNELLQKIPNYIFDVPWEKHKTDDATFKANIAYVIDVFRQRVQAAKLAASRGHWDMLLVVFKSIDNMLHFTWDYVFDGKSYPERHELTLKAFRELDNSCEQLAMLAGYPKTNILLCSDHGHGPVKGHLFVNRLLFEWGLLKPQTKPERFVSRFLISCYKRLAIDKSRKKPSANVGIKMQVEWHKSKAVMIEGGTIHLNVKGRQPNGIVAPEQYYELRDDIAAKLKSFKNNMDDKPLIQKVECPSEASPRPVLSSQPVIPDILFEPVDGVMLKGTTREGPVWQPGRPSKLQGCHYVDGFVLGAGPAFAKGACAKGNLYDIAPTALAAFGLPIPRGLEGKPVFELIADKKQIKYEDSENVAAEKNTVASKTAYNSSEEKLITQRLKDLGYLQ